MTNQKDSSHCAVMLALAIARKDDTYKWAYNDLKAAITREWEAGIPVHLIVNNILNELAEHGVSPQKVYIGYYATVVSEVRSITEEIETNTPRLYVFIGIILIMTVIVYLYS